MYPNDVQVAFPLSISSPLNRGLGSRRNSPVKQLTDNLGWQKGSHILNFGFLYLHGPWFTRFDTSAFKNTRTNERWNVELRAELLNTFNHVNFMVGGPTAAKCCASTSERRRTEP
jgi:hypothetical protein